MVKWRLGMEAAKQVLRTDLQELPERLKALVSELLTAENESRMAMDVGVMPEFVIPLVEAMAGALPDQEEDESLFVALPDQCIHVAKAFL